MRRKLKSIFGVMVLVLLLCSVVGITALANKVVNEGDKNSSFTKGVQKASPSETAPPEEDEIQDDTIVEETVEKELVKNRLAKASNSNAEYIAAEDVEWYVGENSWEGQDCPGWGKWNKDQLSDEEIKKVRRTIAEVFLNGESYGFWSSGYSEGAAMDFRKYFDVAGDYQFRVTYSLTNQHRPEDDKDWSELSDIYTYSPPATKVNTPNANSLKWNTDGSMTWKAVEWKGKPLYPAANGRYIVYMAAKGPDDTEFQAEDFSGTNANTCTNFAKYLKPGYTYRYKVCALGDLINYANSDYSGWSKEFSMNENAEKGAGIIGDMNNEKVLANVENANLSKEDKDSLKLAVQNNPAVEDLYMGLEAEYKLKADKPDLEIGTGESGVDKKKVTVVGGVLNKATKILFEKPTEADLNQAQVAGYKKYAAINISLEGISNKDLKFPVLITMPVPEGINPQQFTIIHVKHDGTKETLIPRINEDDTATFAVTEFSAFLFVDNTPSGGGSTSGGGSSSGSRSSAKADSLETSGTWSQSEMGWQFTRLDGKTTASQWLMNGDNWFRFDEKGYMITGWFADAEGRKFYLNPISDGFKGIMKTGWQTIEGKWYYFNPVSDGTKGALLVNTMTPDGYSVNAEGAWIQ